MKRVEKYELVEVIGQGEYGKVYRGVDVESQKEVAIKVINRETQDKTPELEGFLRNEQEVLGMTDCAQIVQLIEMLRQGDKLYLVYNLCSGGNLEQLLSREGRLDERQTIDIFRQVV